MSDELPSELRHMSERRAIIYTEAKQRYIREYPLAYFAGDGLLSILLNSWKSLKYPEWKQLSWFSGQDFLRQAAEEAVKQLRQPAAIQVALTDLTWVPVVRSREPNDKQTPLATRFFLIDAYMDQICFPFQHRQHEPERLLKLAGTLLRLCSGEEMEMDLLNNNTTLRLERRDISTWSQEGCDFAFKCVAITLRELGRMHTKLFGPECGQVMLFGSPVLPAQRATIDPKLEPAALSTKHDKQGKTTDNLRVLRKQLPSWREDKLIDLDSLARFAFSIVENAAEGVQLDGVPKHLIPSSHVDDLFSSAQDALDAITKKIDSTIVSQASNQFELWAYGDRDPPILEAPHPASKRDDAFYHRCRKLLFEHKLRRLVRLPLAGVKRMEIANEMMELCSTTAPHTEKDDDEKEVDFPVVQPINWKTIRHDWKLELVVYLRCALVGVAQYLMWHFDGRQVLLWGKQVPKTAPKRVEGWVPLGRMPPESLQ